jgi:hypothetical protein
LAWIFSALVIGTFNMFLFAFDRPWTAYRIQLICGALMLLALLGAAVIYEMVGYARRAAFLFFGVPLGSILQRLCFCLVNAF